MHLSSIVLRLFCRRSTGVSCSQKNEFLQNWEKRVKTHRQSTSCRKILHLSMQDSLLESVLFSNVSKRFLECPICLDYVTDPYACVTRHEGQDGEDTYSACHVFCHDCIEPMFQNGESCPQCRGEIVGRGRWLIQQEFHVLVLYKKC